MAVVDWAPSSEVEDYVSWREAYNGITENRATTIRRTLALWESFLGAEQPTPMALERFLAAGGHAPTTVLKHLKIIRAYLGYQRRHGMITADLYLNLMEVKAPRGSSQSRPKPYTRTEISRMWSQFALAYPWTGRDDIHNSVTQAEYLVKRYQLGKVQLRRILPYAQRLQAEAIIALALFGGLRRKEIHGLSLIDAHYQNDHLRFEGAAKNEHGDPIPRVVPMVRPMRHALGNWIEFRAQVLEPPHDELWMRLYGQTPFEPMALDSMHEIVDRIGSGYKLHRLRHTFATERLRAGVDIEVLQAMLGHTSIEMTLRYAQIGDEDVLKRAAATDEDFARRVERQNPNE